MTRRVLWFAGVFFALAVPIRAQVFLESEPNDSKSTADFFGCFDDSPLAVINGQLSTATDVDYASIVCAGDGVSVSSAPLR